jgi:hypothetical protein
MEAKQILRKILDTNAAADYTKRSPGAIRNMVMRKQIPYRKVAGRLLFFTDELDDWMDRSPGLPLEEFFKDEGAED